MDYHTLLLTIGNKESLHLSSCNKMYHFRLAERLIWLVVVFGGFGTAVYLIRENFAEAKANPILTTIDTVDITNVPFPAVTVIPGK